jgi:hypothetical protein
MCSQAHLPLIEGFKAAHGRAWGGDVIIEQMARSVRASSPCSGLGDQGQTVGHG